jgi:hypothetical protein
MRAPRRDNPRIDVPVDHIKSVVAKHYGVTPADIDSRSNLKEVIEARHISMAIAYTMNQISYPALARIFQRSDHTTIRHAVRSAARRYPKQLAEMRLLTQTTPLGSISFEKGEAGGPEVAPHPAPAIEQPEPRAERFVPRRIKPAKKLFAAGRPRCVTGYLMGDPGSQSARIDRGEISGGVV